MPCLQVCLCSDMKPACSAMNHRRKGLINTVFSLNQFDLELMISLQRLKYLYFPRQNMKLHLTFCQSSEIDDVRRAVTDCGILLMITKQMQRNHKNLFMPFANNKGTDKPAHPRSIISDSFVHCLDSMKPIIALALASLCSWASQFESYRNCQPDDKAPSIDQLQTREKDLI